MSHDVIPHRRNGKVSTRKDHKLRKVLHHETHQCRHVANHIESANHYKCIVGSIHFPDLLWDLFDFIERSIYRVADPCELIDAIVDSQTVGKYRSD